MWSSKTMWIRTLSVLLASVAIVASAPQERVVSGTNSDITKYPFMASLRSSTGSHSCGCSIIRPNWILTAAHCVDGRSASSITIQYAVTDINAAGPNLIKVKRVIIHENYRPASSYANDIALLELDGRLIYNYKTIAPVTLPAQNYEIAQVKEGAHGVLTGWGLNATGGVIQRTLQEVDLKIFSDEECNSRHNGETTTDHICGGVDEGGKGQCSGDSGGPLLEKSSNGLVQLGIVSWSRKPCAIYPFPGVYTKVSHYINWINKNAN